MKRSRSRVAVAAASRESRARKKRELDDLRSANAQLKGEKEALLAKMSQLESQVAHNISHERIRDVAENSALRMEIEQHQRFISAFMRLPACEADPAASLAGQRELCREGAEAAQAYVQAMIAESQDGWQPLEMPAGARDDKLAMRFCFRDNFFGGGGFSTSSAAGPRKRFNMRLDFSFPGVDAAKIADYYWRLYRSHKEMERLLGMRGLELEEVDLPDENTALLHSRMTWDKRDSELSPGPQRGPQDAVFVMNRIETEMPQSALRPPAVVDAAEVEAFVGTAKATVVSMTSTRSTHETLKSYRPNPAPSPPGAEMHHVTSVIAQGAVVWEDEKNDTTRLLVVLSYPEEFKLFAEYAFSDLVASDDRIVAPMFAKKLDSILRTFFADMYGDDTASPAPAPHCDAGAHCDSDVTSLAESAVDPSHPTSSSAKSENPQAAA